MSILWFLIYCKLENIKSNRMDYVNFCETNFKKSRNMADSFLV